MPSLSGRFRRYSCFLFVGIFSTFVDWGLFWASLNFFYLNYLFATVISFSSGALVNFFLNKKFTFESRSSRVKRQLAVFFGIALASLCLSLFLMYLFVGVFGFEKLLSRMAATFILFFFNYVAHRSITFSKSIFSD